MSSNDSSREIWGTVEALNKCWTEGDPADLRKYFHKKMVAITPASDQPIVGQEACVSAWTEYSKSTKILSFRTQEPRIQIFDKVAIVVYLYEMDCQRDGVEFHPRGRDMMVLVKEEDGKWWVVADQFSPFPGGGDD